MLFSAEQAFVGRDERRAPLKTPVWEARWIQDPSLAMNNVVMTSPLLF